MREKRNIGIFSLTMLNVAAVLSVVNFPDQAEYGYGIVFFLLAGALCFLVPCGMVAAELASAWPKEGGFYLWGRLAFGPKWGFAALMLQWLNTLPLFGVTLTFTAGVLGCAAGMNLPLSPWTTYAILLAILWSCTALNCLGVKMYAFAGAWSALLGTVLPTFILIACAVLFFLSGNKPAIPFDTGSLFPDFRDTAQLMFFAGIMVSLSGIDMSALHITEVKKPALVYHAAIFISVFVIVLCAILGSLAIALVIPPDTLSTADGVPETVRRLFTLLHIEEFTAPFCLLLALGGISTVIAWSLGPSLGLHKIAKEGHLSAFWAKVNKKEIPVRILLAQATLTSLLASVVLFMPDVNDAFWFLMVVTSQFYMSMYLILFAAGFALRLKFPLRERPFRIPGGIPGMAFVCSIGMLSALGAIAAGFIPPENIVESGSVMFYLGGLAAVLIGMGTFLYFAAHRLFRDKKTGTGE